jgi:hypothetical protein
VLGQLGELSNPLDAIVLHIPKQPHRAGGSEDSHGLVQKSRHLEPVGGLPGHDGVHRAIRKRQGLGNPGSRVGTFDSSPHLRIGFDSDDLAAETNKHFRQLAGARADIDNRASCPWEDESHRVLGVAWSAASVRLGCASEHAGSRRRRHRPAAY